MKKLWRKLKPYRTATLAFLYPFVVTVVGTVATWIDTGEFNAQEVRTALAGLIASALAAYGAWAGRNRPADAPSPRRRRVQPLGGRPRGR